MTTIHIIIFSIVLVIVGVSLWQLISNRKSLPCHSQLGWMVELDNPFTKTNHASVIIDLLGLQPYMRVLDAGCELGRLSIPAYQAICAQGELTELDLQVGMLAPVQHKAQTEGLSNLRFIQAELGDWKLEKNYYDCALMVTVLGEVSDQESAVSVNFETLKPGGIFSVTEVIFDPHFQSRAAVQRVANKVGFLEVGFFGKPLAYTMYFVKKEKSLSVQIEK